MNAWDFHRHLVESWPPTLTLQGVFGVKMLYTYDPTALHHILIKDQHDYEETTFFLKYVMHLGGGGCSLCQTTF